MFKTILSEAYRPTGAETRVGGGRYELRKRVGKGSFGDIFIAYDIHLARVVAVKLEKKSVTYPQLEYEMSVYQILNPYTDPAGPQSLAASRRSGDGNQPPIIPGIPRAHFFAKEGEVSMMALDLCGPSLEDVFNFCHRRFSLKTVLMLVEQMLTRIEYVHSCGFLHRDIKPENYVLGRGPFGNVVHMIDFGLAKLYIDKTTRKHVPFADKKPLTGTARYCACNAHRGYEQSRRDDLESIGFLLIYFIKGVLPWQGIQGKDQRTKTRKIGEKKIATSLESLAEGLPSAFLSYLTYCRELTFNQDPDYEYLRELFRTVAKEYGFTCGTSSGIPPLSNVVSSRPSIAADFSPRSTGGSTNNFRSPSTSPSPRMKRGGGPPRNPLVPASRHNSNVLHAAIITTTSSSSSDDNESYETIPVEEGVGSPVVLPSTSASRRGTQGQQQSSATASHRSTIHPPPLYDWMFDWIVKRSDELQQHWKAHHQSPSSNAVRSHHPSRSSHRGEQVPAAASPKSPQLSPRAAVASVLKANRRSAEKMS